MTALMRAMVLERPGPAADEPLVAKEMALPEPAPGMLVVRVSACGVCRTDLQLCAGDIEAHLLPLVPGNFTRADAREFLELAADIPIRSAHELHRLADANSALRRQRDGLVHGAAVLVP